MDVAFVIDVVRANDVGIVQLGDGVSEDDDDPDE
jgi:hypothetical protein